MKQRQHIFQHLYKYEARHQLIVLILSIKPCLHQLDIPIAVLVPNEIVNPLPRQANSYFSILFVISETAWLSLVKSTCLHLSAPAFQFLPPRPPWGRNRLFVQQIHYDKSQAFHNLFAKLRQDSSRSILKRRSFRAYARCQHKAQCIRPYWSMISSGSMPFPRDLLIFRLPHLSPVHERRRDGKALTRHCQGREHHSHYPEKYNVITGNQHVRGEIMFQIRCLLRPSHSREWP